MLHVHALPYRDPLAALQAFAAEPELVFLDSAASDAGRGRHAYIMMQPCRTIRVTNGTVLLDGAAVDADPFRLVAEVMAEYPPAGPGPVPFTGGAAGYFGYELGGFVEALPDPAPDPAAAPDMAIGIYGTLAAFDLERRRAWVIARDAEKGEAMRARILSAPASLPEPDWRVTGRWEFERGRAEQEAAIARVIAYIRAGDIFQANLTQRLLAEMPEGLDDLTLYRRLRALSPAPFAAFLRCGKDVAVMSASPERFLRLDADGHVETRPIKGTRARDPDPARDAALAAELLASSKDLAENLMIADLMRNDIGRVCRTGSVRVPVLAGLESFASVHHLVSVVEGRMRDGLGPLDLLRACFPGGSITGAPKIRAMEIIRELEPAPRGVYCGAIGWIGFDGAMDTSIVIRTLTRTGRRLAAQAGGGIVADSDPAAEWEESMLKMQPLLRALTGERA